MKRNRVNIVTWGGLGDALLMTPAIRAIKEGDPRSRVTVYYLKRHRDIFLNNPYIDRLREATFRGSPFSTIKASLNLFKYLSPNYSGQLSQLDGYGHITELIAERLGTRLGVQGLEIYLTKDEMTRGESAVAGFKRPVAFDPYAVSNKNKEWMKGSWERLIQAMPGHSFIQLGVLKDALVPGAVDMRGRALRDSVAIIRASSCYVGVDSFLAHAAAAVHTPGVVMFGASSSANYGHWQHINIDKKLICAPCVEFTANAACPYGKECMRQITVEEVRRAVLAQIACGERMRSLSSGVGKDTNQFIQS